MTELRRLGQSEIFVTPISMGCWPIAGITSLGVTRENSLATIAQAFDAGINFFDTAYCYGYDGESEQMVGEVLRPHRHKVVIATKGGIVWGPDKKQVRDGRPESILRHCDESLSRLGMDVIDLYYLHAPDPQVPVAETAGAFCQLHEAGKILTAGASNVSLEQLQEFHAVCPLSAYQPHYNMLQREIETSQLPWCRENSVSVMVYWPLMKGLLAGKISRDHQFDERDGRRKYPMFQGAEWDKTHDFLDKLRQIANEQQITVAQLVLAWTIQRPGITAALCGAKRPDQILDNAAALHVSLSDTVIQAIDQAIADRGPVQSRAAV